MTDRRSRPKRSSPKGMGSTLFADIFDAQLMTLLLVGAIVCGPVGFGLTWTEPIEPQASRRNDSSWVTVSPTGNAGDLDPRDFGTRSSDFVSALYVHGVLHGAFPILILSTIVLSSVYRRRAAGRAFDRAATLADGPGFVFGRIELFPEQKNPVVELRTYTRAGPNAEGSPVVEKWRTLRVTPFYLRREDGSLLRVEPDDRIGVDGPSKEMRTGPPGVTRTNIKLKSGEAVYVSGNISQARVSGTDTAYRDPVDPPLLRPPLVGRMVILRRPPWETELFWARYFRGWSIIFAVIGALLVVGAAPFFELLTWDGVPVMADITDINRANWATKSVKARLPSPFEGEVAMDCTEPFYECVEAGKCGKLPLIVSKHFPKVMMMGKGPTIQLPSSMAIVMMCVSCFGLFLFSLRRFAEDMKPQTTHLKTKVRAV
jgi:hypothetical protein